MIAVLATMASSLGAWQAADAAPGLRAKLYLTQKGIPRSLSESGVLRFAQSNKATKLQETTDVPIDDRQWRATLVANFNAPVGDSEFEVLFYDIQTAERKFIAPTMTVFVNDRNQRTIVMEMVVTVRRQEVGRYRFQILGDKVQHSGEVTFSDDEAH